VSACNLGEFVPVPVQFPVEFPAVSLSPFSPAPGSPEKVAKVSFHAPYGERSKKPSRQIGITKLTVLMLRKIPSNCALVELEQSQEQSKGGGIWLMDLIST